MASNSTTSEEDWFHLLSADILNLTPTELQRILRKTTANSVNLREFELLFRLELNKTFANNSTVNSIKLEPIEDSYQALVSI